MYVKRSIFDFQELKENSWSGAIATLETIEEHGKEDELMNWLDCEYDENNPIDETELNDLLWFEDEYIFEELGINEDEENDDEE